MIHKSLMQKTTSVKALLLVLYQHLLKQSQTWCSSLSNKTVKVMEIIYKHISLQFSTLL